MAGHLLLEMKGGCVRNFIFIFSFLTGLMIQPAPAYSQSVVLANGSPCVGSDIVFTLQGSCTSTTWAVNNEGIISSYDNNSVHVKWNTATKSASVTANSYCDGNSWQSYSLYNIAINAVATSSVALSLVNTNVCQGGSMTFTAAPTNGGDTPYYNFYVDGSSAPVYGGPSNSYIYSTNGLSPGPHSVYVRMTTSYPCVTLGSYVSNSPSINFNVTARSVYSVVTMGPPQICSGTANAEFFAKVSDTIGDLSYQWYLNGYPIDGATSNPYTINGLIN